MRRRQLKSQVSSAHSRSICNPLQKTRRASRTTSRGGSSTWVLPPQGRFSGQWGTRSRQTQKRRDGSRPRNERRSALITRVFVGGFILHQSRHAPTPTSLTGSFLPSNSLRRSLVVCASTSSMLVKPARDLSLVKVSKWWNLDLDACDPEAESSLPQPTGQLREPHQPLRRRPSRSLPHPP